MFTLNKPVTSIFQASREERHGAIFNLIAPATGRRGYYLLLGLSICIISAGLLAESTPVIIGGMVMAPLLIPILSLSLSLVTGSQQGLLHSLRVMAYSILLTLGISFLITWALSQSDSRVVWFPESIDSLIYVFIAICSGVAAGFAWVKEDFAPSIAGIATAVSLLPPLCAVGISLAQGDLQLAETSALIFVLNLGGILAGASSVFVLLGFVAFRRMQDKVVKQQTK